MSRLGLRVLLVALVVSPSISATAVTIDFESFPTGLPAEGLSITDQFASTTGVTFSVSDGAPFILGAYGGSSPVAWTLQPPYSGSNLLISPYNRGSWFAFVDNADSPGRFLEIAFSGPVAEVSLDLVDVDLGNTADIDGGRERAVIRAYGIADQLLGSIQIAGGDPGTGDGIPTTIPLAFSAQQITRIEVEALAWGGGAVDDLSFTPVPEPSSAALLCFGLVALVARRAR